MFLLPFSCVGCRCPDAGIEAFLRALQVNPSRGQPVPADPQQITAKPICQASGPSGKMYLKKGRILCGGEVREIALQVLRSEEEDVLQVPVQKFSSAYVADHSVAGLC